MSYNPNTIHLPSMPLVPIPKHNYQNCHRRRSIHPPTINAFSSHTKTQFIKIATDVFPYMFNLGERALKKNVLPCMCNMYNLEERSPKKRFFSINC
ncbi:hypothetical protein AMTRI_Chr03g52720 [Amborella trichopoda]